MTKRYKCPECENNLDDKKKECCKLWNEIIECMEEIKKITNEKEKYKCPACNIHLNESMFCVKCCSKWTKSESGKEESDEAFMAWAIAQDKIEEESHNNGGDTDYYKIPSGAEYCQDIIESREMNFSQGNILKAAFCFGIKRGNSDYERDLNKIIWFANRELERIK